LEKTFSEKTFLDSGRSSGKPTAKMSGAFDMGAAVRVSPLIKTCRWTALLLGIWWGNKRYNQLKIVEDEKRAYNARMKPIWDEEKRVEREKNARLQLITLAKDVGVPVPKDF